MISSYAATSPPYPSSPLIRLVAPSSITLPTVSSFPFPPPSSPVLAPPPPPPTPAPLPPSAAIPSDSKLTVFRPRLRHTICEVCPVPTSWKCEVDLYEHIYKVHLLLVCPNCLANLQGSLSTLQEHLATHSQGRPHWCKFCGTGFQQPHHLREHERIHTGEKPFVCTFEGCNESFARNSYLVQHYRIHTKDKLYTCLECNKSFTQYSTLLRHIRVHTGEKPYVCAQCPKTFRHSQSKKEHELIHHGIVSVSFIVPSGMKVKKRTRIETKPLQTLTSIESKGTKIELIPSSLPPHSTINGFTDAGEPPVKIRKKRKESKSGSLTSQNTKGGSSIKEAATVTPAIVTTIHSSNHEQSPQSNQLLPHPTLIHAPPITFIPTSLPINSMQPQSPAYSRNPSPREYSFHTPYPPHPHHHHPSPYPSYPPYSHSISLLSHPFQPAPISARQQPHQQEQEQGEEQKREMNAVAKEEVIQRNLVQSSSTVSLA